MKIRIKSTKQTRQGKKRLNKNKTFQRRNRELERAKQTGFIVRKKEEEKTNEKMPGLIGISEFVDEAMDDYKSPTTSTFVEKMPQCRQTISELEDVSCDYKQNQIQFILLLLLLFFSLVLIIIKLHKLALNARKGVLKMKRDIDLVGLFDLDERLLSKDY